MVYGKRRLPSGDKLKKVYVEDLLTGSEIAEKYGVNKSYVYAELKRLNISSLEAVHIPQVCSYWKCKKKFTVQRNRVKQRNKKKLLFNYYCSATCYQKSRKSVYSVKKRKTSSSRRIVSTYMPFNLTSKMVVHHVNNNAHDLTLSNLWVFKNQSEHSKFHHRIRINKTRWQSY